MYMYRVVINYTYTQIVRIVTFFHRPITGLLHGETFPFPDNLLLETEKDMLHYIICRTIITDQLFM